MKLKSGVFLFIFSFLFCFQIVADELSKSDSLTSALKNSANDTVTVNLLNSLFKEYKNYNPDTAFIIAESAQKLARKNNFSKGLNLALSQAAKLYAQTQRFPEASKVYYQLLQEKTKQGDKNAGADYRLNIGDVAFFKADFSKAIENYESALQLFQNNKDTSQILICYLRLGFCNYNIGNYAVSLDSYLKALKIAEQKNDKATIFSCYSSIANIYFQQGDAKLAIDYQHKAIQLAKESGNKKDLASSLMNLGGVYSKKKMYDLSLEYHTQSMKLWTEIGNPNGIAYCALNIAEDYKATDKQELALENYEKAKNLSAQVGDVNLNTAALLGLGNYYYEKKDWNNAKEYYTLTLTQAKEIESMEYMRESYKSLSDLYAKQKNYQLAYENYLQYSVLKDSTYNSDNTQKVTQLQMTYAFEKKQDALQAEQNKKDTENKEANKRSTIVRNALIVGVLFTALLLLMVINRYRIKQKANTLLELQKQEIELQKKAITDSINYAQRIQQSILPTAAYVKTVLPNSFILNKPKDIVSGDFYWLHETAPENYSAVNNKVILALADCTGHGVPGAFMSMLGVEILNDAVKESHSPAKILHLMNEGIKKSLHQNNELIALRDGMDVIICSIDFEKGMVKYAGANRPLLKISNGELEEYFPTKVSIGGYQDYFFEFENTEVKLQKGDTLYLFSDGYADQFGGEKNKKLTTKKFKNEILTMQHLSMDEQKNYLDSFLTEWAGSNQQVDDVMVIGIRV